LLYQDCNEQRNEEYSGDGEPVGNVHASPRTVEITQLSRFDAGNPEFLLKSPGNEGKSIKNNDLPGVLRNGSKRRKALTSKVLRTTCITSSQKFPQLQ
jgi:hypothetical protein